MASREMVFILAAFLPWIALGGLYGFIRVRLAGFAEQAVAEQRLKRGVAAIEFVVLLGLMVVAIPILFDGFSDLHRVAHGDAGTTRPGGAATVMMAVAATGGALIPARLIVLLLAAVLPDLRKAHRAAMEGLPTQSLARSGVRLLAIGLITVPLGMAQGVFGALEPWARW